MLQLVRTEQKIQRDAACDLNALCDLSLLHIKEDALNAEAMKISKCLHNNIEFSAKNSELLKCVVSDIRRKFQCATRGDENDKMRHLFCDSALESGINESKSDFGCILCLLAQVHLNVGHISDNQSVTDVSDNHLKHIVEKENFYKLMFVTNLILTQNITYNYSLNNWIERFFDVRNWDTHYLNKETEILLEKLLKKYLGMEYYTPDDNLQTVFNTICLTIISVSIIINGVLLHIFVRNKELRTDQNLMIFNLTIANLINVMVCSVMFFLPSVWVVDWYHNVTSLSYAYIINITIGVSAYSVTILSIQRYIAVASLRRVHKPNCWMFRRFRLGLMYVSWLFSCIISLLVLLLFATFPTENHAIFSIIGFFVYSFIPVVAVTSLSVAASRHLKKSILLIPGEPVGMETLKRVRARSANMLIASSMVFTAGYLPSFMMDVISNSFFQETDMMFFFLQEMSLILLLMNSCSNPISLYVLSKTFRSHINGYLSCCNTRNLDRQITAPKVKYRTTLIKDLDVI